ncbi:hypothetical protein B7494_g873 [Chlorociboria aeruginascens]|nr:hypothetical protein B7494_g873 [Chlorociboria aeruginascens]
MRGLPAEIYDTITLYVEDPKFHDGRHVVEPSQIYDTAGRQRLSVLRLINKGFCRSASLRLFRIIHAKLSDSRLQESPDHWAPKRLFELSQSPYCAAVREIEVDINIFGYHSSADLRLFIEDLAALLPVCLCNFRDLSALSISFPDEPQPLCTELLNNIFRYVPLSSLKKLRLALPLTYDFATLLMQNAINSSTPSRSSLKSTMKQLKYLSVLINNSSGFGGNRFYQRPPSSSQRAFPNEEYSVQFFELIQLAEELESLRISCTHVLNMDALDATHLYKLHSLELRRVKISHTMLLSIMERNRKTLRSIFLWSVELKSGTWTDVLIQLCLHPHLEVFHMESCRYARDGQSSRWAPGLLPPIDDPRDIETVHVPDTFALGNLQRQVNANRHVKGLLEMGEYYYRHVGSEPVENVLTWWARGD